VELRRGTLFAVSPELRKYKTACPYSFPFNSVPPGRIVSRKIQAWAELPGIGHRFRLLPQVKLCFVKPLSVPQQILSFMNSSSPLTVPGSPWPRKMISHCHRHPACIYALVMTHDYECHHKFEQ
jgi:hypothetical protein